MIYVKYLIYLDTNSNNGTWLKLDCCINSDMTVVRRPTKKNKIKGLIFVTEIENLVCNSIIRQATISNSSPSVIPGIPTL